MQLRTRTARGPRFLRRRAGVAAATVLLAVPAGSPAEQVVQSSYHYFADSEGNAIDSYAVDLVQHWSTWGLAVRGALDRVHLPPLPGLPGSRENVDAITAASRPVASAAASKEAFTKQRAEMTGTMLWRTPERRLRGSGSYYVSRESDYLGQQVSADLGRDWNGGSTSIALRGAFGFDRITPDAHTGGDPTAHSRNTVDVTGVWVQSLTPKTQSTVGLELTSVQGFQSNPYRQVYAGGTSLPERHPEERLRASVFGQLDRYLGTRSSVSAGARWYDDDWGVRAATFDLHFNQYVGERLIVRYRYRYHIQTAASFYREIYPTAAGVDGYRTADYKLQDFDSNLFGIKLSVPFEGTTSWLEGLLLDLKYERYFDSHSFAANVLETGFSWPF